MCSAAKSVICIILVVFINEDVMLLNALTREEI